MPFVILLFSFVHNQYRQFTSLYPCRASCNPSTHILPTAAHNQLIPFTMAMASPTSTPGSSATSTDVNRLRSLFASGDLMHPYLSSQIFAQAAGGDDYPSSSDDGVALNDNDVHDNFVDLAASLSICCGVTPPEGSRASSDECDESSFFMENFTSNKHVEREIRQQRLRLASEIGGSLTTDSNGNNAYTRRHIILILCDGMGNSILQNTLNANPDDDLEASFFIRNNHPSRLRAVFPSTTPAALTTLATAAWPGRHGRPVEQGGEAETVGGEGNFGEVEDGGRNVEVGGDEVSVHLGAGVAQTSHDLFEPTRGGGHERGVAGSLPSPAIRARAVLKQQIHQCEVTVFRG